MILGLYHAQISIPKGMEEQGRQFYVGVLGLTEIDKPTALQGRGGFWMQVGDREVHVGTEDGVDRNKTKSHLAYRVQRLAEWRQKLQSLGVRVDDSVPIPGYHRFEFRDPFGNRVELIEPISEPERQ